MVANVCRCCLSEASYKDISNEYITSSNEKEVYADILFDTFNLKISYQESCSRLICEECVLRLRDAAAFKKQVQQVEDVVTRSITNGDYLKSSDLKPVVEHDDFIDHITGDFDDDIDDSTVDDDQCFDDDFYWGNDDPQVQDDARVLVIKLDPEEDIPLQLLQNSKVNKSANKKCTQKVVGLVTDKKTVKKTEKPQKTAKQKEKKIKRKLPESERKENSLNLINNSNICLFESLKTKFRCFYCKNTYLNISELREHSLTHNNVSYLKMCINRLQGMSYKCVDISNLTCKLCPEKLNNLSDLQTHLSEIHEIKFSGEENMLIQYRLENGFICAFCDEKFNSFCRLAVHMNKHYMNNVCETCGSSYINRLSLRMHVNSRHKEKRCSFCPAMFSNAYLRIKHMRRTHNAGQSKRYCLLCDKTFRYTYLLEEHKIQEHGKKRPVSVCAECGKSFLSPVNLRTHIRCVHVKERNHSCALCGMCFFTSCDKRRHERTHQDLRCFACSYCDGRFKSKDSLRRHLKRQHGHLYNT